MRYLVGKGGMFAAPASYLAASCNDALGQSYNVVDAERTTIEEYYRIVIRKYLPDKSGMKSRVPSPLGQAWGRLGGRRGSPLVAS